RIVWERAQRAALLEYSQCGNLAPEQPAVGAAALKLDPGEQHRDRVLAGGGDQAGGCLDSVLHRCAQRRGIVEVCQAYVHYQDRWRAAEAEPAGETVCAVVVVELAHAGAV